MINLIKEVKVNLLEWTQFCAKVLKRKVFMLFTFSVTLVSGLLYFYVKDYTFFLIVFSISASVFLTMLLLFISDIPKNIKARFENKKSINKSINVTIGE